MFTSEGPCLWRESTRFLGFLVYFEIQDSKSPKFCLFRGAEGGLPKGAEESGNVI